MTQLVVTHIVESNTVSMWPTFRSEGITRLMKSHNTITLPLARRITYIP